MATIVCGVDLSLVKKWTHVSVEWEDASHEPDAVKSENFVKNYHPAIRHTAGWFVHADAGRIFIALSKDIPRPEDDDDTDCQAIDTLPFGMIRAVTLLYPRPLATQLKKRGR